MAYKVTSRIGAVSQFWRDKVYEEGSNGILLAPWLIWVYISKLSTMKLNCYKDNKNVYVSILHIERLHHT